MRVHLLVPLLAATVVASPVSPAYADDADISGYTCGLDTSNDPSGVVIQDPAVQFGRMTMGPMSTSDVFDDPSAGPTHAMPSDSRLSCWVQVNVPHYTGPWGFPSSSCATSPAETAQSCLVQYTVLPTDHVFVCTQVEWHHAGTYGSWRYDANPVATGDQCAQATVTVSGTWYRFTLDQTKV